MNGRFSEVCWFNEISLDNSLDSGCIKSTEGAVEDST